MHDAGKRHEKGGHGGTTECSGNGPSSLCCGRRGCGELGPVGADRGWTQWTWLALGGVILVLGAIGYSPLHALFGTKDQKAS